MMWVWGVAANEEIGRLQDLLPLLVHRLGSIGSYGGNVTVTNNEESSIERVKKYAAIFHHGSPNTGSDTSLYVDALGGD